MKLNDALNYRYSTKMFDTSKKISAEDMKEVKNLLRMAPSSVNSQAWNFIIAESEEGKAKVAKATGGFYSFNTSKVLDASAVVVFTTKKKMDDEFLDLLLAKEEADGRFPSAEIKAQNDGGRRAFNNIHNNDLKDSEIWLSKQVYLNIGTFLLGMAVMGIDSVPMEGFDAGILSKELNLEAQGLTPLAIVPIGYRSADDYNALLPKSRLAEDKIITII